MKIAGQARKLLCGGTRHGNIREKLGDLEFGPWLGQASMLVVDDEPGMRSLLVRTLGPLCKRIEKTFDTEGAPRKRDAGLHHTFARRAGAERTSEFRVSLVVADECCLPGAMTDLADQQVARHRDTK